MADTLETGRRSDLPCGLSSNTRQYVYTNKDDYLSILRRELDSFVADPKHNPSEYIIFRGVTSEIYQRDFNDEHCDTFIPAINTVLIEMKTLPHEVAHAEFDHEFMCHLQAMGDMDKYLVPHAATTVEGATRRKEADQSYAPRRLPPSRSRKWPTVVVEAGFSENQGKLADDVNFWLSESNGAVKAVITISVNRHERRIVFETWSNVIDSDGGSQIDVTFTNIVTKDDNRDDIDVSNTNPLVLRFEDIFLRPAYGPQERDVEMSPETLQEISALVWDMQFGDNEEEDVDGGDEEEEEKQREGVGRMTEWQEEDDGEEYEDEDKNQNEDEE